MTLAGRNLALATGILAAYGFAVRPRLLRWGATDDELRRPYPGGGLALARPDGL